MNRKSEAESFWDLINHFEDYLNSGIAKEHESFLYAKIENDQNEALAVLEEKPVLDTSLWEYRTLPPEKKREEWKQCAEKMNNCRLCSLSENRTAVVPGTAATSFEISVITDFPLSDEEFSYLTKWLSSVGLTPGKEAAVTSVLKCRSDSSNPVSERAIEACRSYLEQQLAIASPKLIFAVGELFLRFFLKVSEPVAAVSGRLFQYQNIPVAVTFSPRAVLDNPELRRPVWEELKTVRRLLDNRK